MQRHTPSLPIQLARIDLSDFNRELEDIDSALIEDTALEETAKNLTITNSMIKKSDLSKSNVEKLDLHNVLIDDCSLAAGIYRESSWHTVEVSDTRCSGIQLDRSTLKDVTFRGCKLDMANFRFGKFSQVTFENCVIDEMDFYGADLKNVNFINCELINLVFQNATLKNVDLRSSKLVRIKKVDDLKGATINSEQLMQLASQLAQHAGIIVDD